MNGATAYLKSRSDDGRKRICHMDYVCSQNINRLGPDRFVAARLAVYTIRHFIQSIWSSL